jgi:hypothetical protein
LHGRYQTTPPRSHSTMLFPATMSHSTRHWRPCQRPWLDDHNLVSQFAPMDLSMGFATSPHYETSPCSSLAASLVLVLLVLLFPLHTLPTHRHSTNSSMTPFPKGPSLSKHQKPPKRQMPPRQAPGSKRAPLPVKGSRGSSQKQLNAFSTGGNRHRSQKGYPQRHDPCHDNPPMGYGHALDSQLYHLYIISCVVVTLGH